MSRIVQYDDHYFLRIPFTPENMEEITRYCPNVFNKPGDSTDPEQTGIIAGHVEQTYGYNWAGTYESFGGSLNQGGDYLERVDESNSRICGYLTDFNEESGEPYIDILCDASGNPRTMSNYLLMDLGWETAPAGTDKTFVLGYTRASISVYNDENVEDSTNLKRSGVSPYSYYYCNIDAGTTYALAQLTPANTFEASGSTSSESRACRVVLNFPSLKSTAVDLFLTASIPIFISEAAAKHYIDTGEIREGTCFNESSMFSDQADEDYYLNSWTFRYNKSKGYVSNDDEAHRLTIQGNGNNVRGYVKEGDYYNIKLKASGSANMSWTMNGVDYTGTVADFNSSEAATSFNTWKEYTYYGRDGFVKGGGFKTNIYIYANKEDMEQAFEDPESVLPINPDDVDDSWEPGDTGLNTDTEHDLVSQVHDGATGLITLYRSTAGALNQLGAELYTASQSLLDALKIYGESPINSLISVHHCPIDLDNFITTESASGFKVGSHSVSSTGVSIVKTYGKIVALGSTLINGKYQDFRDYENFDYELHLPFSNPIKLDASEIVGKTLTIKATVDPYNLQIRYYIIINSVVSQYVDASFGKQIAVLGNDSAGKARELRQNIASLTSAGANVAMSVATANPVGAMMNIAAAGTGIVNTLEASKREAHKQVVGTFAPGCAENDILYPYLQIIEQVSIKPPSLESVYGRPTNLVTKLGNVRGFTCAELTQVAINCTDAEKAEIESLVSQGIII